jgi:hypothetical protein
MNYSINDKFAIELRRNLHNKIPYFHRNYLLWRSIRTPLANILLQQLIYSVENELWFDKKRNENSR